MSHRRCLWLLPILIFLGSAVSARSTITNTTELLDDLRQLPQCAITCATSLPATSCPLTDLNCLCTAGNPSNATSAAQQCILKTCTIREALDVQRVVEGICGIPVQKAGGTVLAVTIAFTAFAFLTCAIRLGVRAQNWKLLGFDDVFITAATAMSVVLAANIIMLVKHDLGTSLWGVPYEHIGGIFFWFWVAELVYVTCVFLTKLSVLCFYLRVFTEPSFFWKTYVLLAISAALFISTFFVSVFQCSPVSYGWHYWDKLHTGTCINTRDYLWAQSISNIIMDGLILVLPIPTLLSLTLPTLRKVGLLVVFSLGAFTTAVSILRFTAFNSITFNYLNPTYDLRLAAIWSIVEVCVGNICVCLPTLRPFFRAIRNAIFGEPPADRYEYGRGLHGGANKSSFVSSDKSKGTVTTRSDSTEELYGTEMT